MRERCKDLVGRRVRLLRDVTTKGGHEFPAGTVLTCTGTWRGLFDLIDGEWTPPEGFPSWSRPGVSKVARWTFEVLPQ